MSRDDPVHHKCGAGAVIAPLPPLAHLECANLKCSIVFCICERLIAPVAPSKAAEEADLSGQFLLEIQPETVFVAALAASSNDIRNSMGHLRITVGLFVIPHVGGIQVCQQTDDSGTAHEKISARLHFEILRTRTRHICI